jgi:hypothetical protein
VLRLYPDNGEIERIYESDNRAFVTAMQEIGFKSPEADADPITPAVRAYADTELSDDEAAAELGVTKETLLRAITAYPPLTASLASLLVGKVRRDLFEEQAPTLVRVMAGEIRTVPNGLPQTPFPYSDPYPYVGPLTQAQADVAAGDQVFVHGKKDRFGIVRNFVPALVESISQDKSQVTVRFGDNQISTLPSTEVARQVESFGGFRVGQRVRVRVTSNSGIPVTVEAPITALDSNGFCLVKTDIRYPDYVGPVQLLNLK